MDDQEKKQNTDKRKRATRAERMARLEAQLKELSAQEKRAKKAENWRNIRVMAYAMASALQSAMTNDHTYPVLLRMAQRTLNKRDRERLVAILDQLGLSGKLSSDPQEPLTLQDSGWCRSPMMRDGSPSSGQ